MDHEPPELAPQEIPAPYAPPQRSKNKWIWITLAVLVVCGCGGVILLPAILFPVFLQAKQAAVKTQCMNTAKQLGLAHLVYESEWESLPDADRWLDQIEPYLAQGHDTCPEVRTKGGEYGYAMAKALGGRSSASFREPRVEALLFETSDLKRNAASDLRSDPAPDRHGPGRTVCYLAGSVRYVKPDAN